MQDNNTIQYNQEDTQYDSSEFSEMGPQDIIDVLNITIKRDDFNKLITFMGCLSAYTENPFNISFNAPSSSGKSFIPLQVVRLFPKEDVMRLGHTTPTAFFHETGKLDEKRKVHIIDLSNKIIVFVDQPRNELLARLRPILSHDEKEIEAKMTDTKAKNGSRTKNVVIRGYPAVVFCTAGFNVDEQEATRFFMLSPEIDQTKLQESVHSKFEKESNAILHNQRVEDNPARQLLKKRILAIKDANIQDVRITSIQHVRNRFLLMNHRGKLKPRHQRDADRLLALIKLFAVLNHWWREEIDGSIVANATDIDSAFMIWEHVAYSQELGVPQYILNLYQNIIVELWKEKNGMTESWQGDLLESKGITRNEIKKKHYDFEGTHMSDAKLRYEILPLLETAGLIVQEDDKNDKRRRVIFPSTVQEQNNSSVSSVPPEETIDVVKAFSEQQ